MANFYGSIDLTKLGQVVRQHPELVKTANMKDGTTHQFISIDINEKKEVDQYGNSAYLKVACKKDQQRQGVPYYLCDLKTSQYGSQQQQTQPKEQPAPAADDANALPF